MNNAHDTILRTIDGFLSQQHMAASKLSMLACGSPAAVARIRAGRCSWRTIEKIIGYIGRHGASCADSAPKRPRVSARKIVAKIARPQLAKNSPRNEGQELAANSEACT